MLPLLTGVCEEAYIRLQRAGMRFWQAGRPAGSLWADPFPIAAVMFDALFIATQFLI